MFKFNNTSEALDKILNLLIVYPVYQHSATFINQDCIVVRTAYSYPMPFIEPVVSLDEALEQFEGQVKSDES